MSTGNWEGIPVLVTGARGFIATHLCRRLIDAGGIVHGVSRVPGRIDSPRMHFLSVDLTRQEEVREIVRRIKPRVIFHLAGYVTGSQELSAVQPSFEANLVTTVHLLSASVEQPGCRVVLAGSMQEPDDEAGAGIPCSPYAASKWACSAYARMFHALYQLPVVIARPMLVYGPGQWDDSKLLPSVIISLLNGVAPRLTSGTRELDWVFVDDVVSGLMAVATLPGVEGRTIDLGTGEGTSIRRVAESVKAIMGSDTDLLFGALADRPFERRRVARVAETERLIGWTATTSLQEGLARTIEWFRETIARPGSAAADGASRNR
jgi:UDP-glucose 4-epimerase